MDDASVQESAGERVSTRHVSSARHTLNILTTRLVTLPLTILTSILVVRALGPAQRGIYGFLVLLGAFALPILMLGFGASVTYFISNKRYSVRDVFATCLLVGVAQGAIGAMLLGGLWYFSLLGKTAHQTQASLIIPMLLILPLQGATLTLTRLALGDSWFALGNRVTLATALLTAVMLLILVVALGLGVQGAVLGLVTCNVLVLAGVLTAFTRRYRPAIAFHPEFVREGWRYGLKAWVADLAIHTNLRMDQWVLGMAALPEALGIYGPAVTISEMLWMLPDSLSFVLFNKIAASRGDEEQAALIERLHRVMFWIMVLAGSAVALLAPWLVLLLYGEKYSASAWPLALLMPGTAAMCICKILTKYFGGTGQPQHSGTMAAVGAAAGFVLYLVLIPWFGATGAAIGSSLCYAVTALAAVVIYRSLVAPHKPRLFWIDQADINWLAQQARLAIGRRPHADRAAAPPV